MPRTSKDFICTIPANAKHIPQFTAGGRRDAEMATPTSELTFRLHTEIATPTPETRAITALTDRGARQQRGADRRTNGGRCKRAVGYK